MSLSGHKEITASITGRVQGVNFRSFVKKHADELNLVGYVQNCSDGSVDVTAQGAEDDLKEFIKYLKKGPPFAKVESVDVAWHEKLQDTFLDFQIE